MNNKHIFVLFLSIMTLFSCNNENDVNSILSPTGQWNADDANFTENENFYITTKDKDYHITENEAIDIATNGLFALETRNSLNMTDVNIYTKTRLGISDDSLYNILPETLLYIIPATENMYHVIAADNRIRTKEIGYIPANTLIPNSSDHQKWELSEYLLANILNKMRHDITIFEEEKDSMWQTISAKFDSITAKMKPDSITLNMGITRKKYPGENTPPRDDGWICETSVTYISSNHSEIQPLLNLTWHQQYPYNMLLQDKATCTYSEVPTGCVITAGGMLIAYWKYPSQINGATYDWENITSNEAPVGNNAKTQVATLMRTIGEEIDAQFGCGQTSAQTPSLVSWLNNHGYIGGTETNYNSSDIISSLNMSRPVITIGEDPDKNNAGHSWIIDGYKKRADVYRYIYNYHNELTGAHYTVQGPLKYENSIQFNHNFGHGQKETWLYDGIFTEKDGNDGTTIANYSTYNKIYPNIRPNY